MFQNLQYLPSANVLEERIMNIKPRGKQEEVMANAINLKENYH